MANLTILTDDIMEKTTVKITATVEDENGDGLAAASLDTLTLTLYSLEDDTIINSRDAQDVLNANGVTLDVNGNLIWTVTPADTIIVDTRLKAERHRAVFEWTYDSAAKNGKHVIDMRIINLVKIT